ncbi:MAG: GGDEF domain-containing protein, partial [Spirochaetota bacterium]|nr:GGDEF domain-containing protein [Spirochaetota bacterium]
LVISLFYVSSETYQVGNYFAMTEAIIAMVAGTIRLRRGFKPARIFLAAWFTFSLGVVVMTLRLLGFLPDNIFTHHTMKLGSILEVILLSFALGDRITIMRQDKEKAQHMALRNLEENYRLKEEFARTLEEKIDTRTHELNEKNLELKRLSVTDKLTQLYNRNRIDEILDYEIKQSSRHDRDLSIIMIDLDHFKSVNDQLGHQVGDEVLKEFAGLMREMSRTTDTVGRWGGEEFIVISPNCSGDEIMYLAEKLRKSVESHGFKGVGVMTCSCGVSSYEPGDDEISMLKRADEALYQAKSEGRNRVK